MFSRFRFFKNMLMQEIHGAGLPVCRAASYFCRRSLRKTRDEFCKGFNACTSRPEPESMD
jgi:hypothetical protein